MSTNPPTRGWHHSFYYAIRTELLFWSIFFTVLWVVFGFDSTLSSVGQFLNRYIPVDSENLVPQYGMGFHISSVQNIILVCYALFVNITMGGLSLKQFMREVKKDLIGIPSSFSRRMIPYQRMAYPEIPLLKCIYQLCFSVLITIVCFASFECIWVYLYDYFHFGDLNWPLYYFGSGYPNMLLARNIGSLSLGVACAFLMLAYIKKYFNERYSLRLDTGLLSLLMLTLSLWIFWIISPAPLMSQGPVSFEQFYSSDYGIKNCVSCSLLNKTSGYLMPAQRMFKQTSYTIYVEADYLKPYSSKYVLGFFDNQPFTHFINIATKYVMTFTLAYPFMVRVKHET